MPCPLRRRIYTRTNLSSSTSNVSKPRALAKEEPRAGPGAGSQQRKRSPISASYASPARRALSSQCAECSPEPDEAGAGDRRRRTIGESSEGQSGISSPGAEQVSAKTSRARAKKSPGSKSGALQALSHQPLINPGRSCVRSHQGEAEGLQRSR